MRAIRWLLRVWSRSAGEIIAACIIGGWGCIVIFTGYDLVARTNSSVYSLLPEIWGLPHWARTMAAVGAVQLATVAWGCRRARGIVAFVEGWFCQVMATSLYRASPGVTMWWMFEVVAIVGFGTVVIFVGLWTARHRGWNAR